MNFDLFMYLCTVIYFSQIDINCYYYSQIDGYK